MNINKTGKEKVFGSELHTRFQSFDLKEPSIISVYIITQPLRMLYAVCCMLYAVCCMLYAVCCMLYAVCCMLYDVCCMQKIRRDLPARQTQG